MSFLSLELLFQSCYNEETNQYPTQDPHWSYEVGCWPATGAANTS
jgi:hypothetical protein